MAESRATNSATNSIEITSGENLSQSTIMLNIKKNPTIYEFLNIVQRDSPNMKQQEGEVQIRKNRESHCRKY